MKSNIFKLMPLMGAILITGCKQDWPELNSPGIPPVAPVGQQIASFDNPMLTGDCEDATFCWAGWNVIQSADVDSDAFVFGAANEKVMTPAGGWTGAGISNWSDEYNGDSFIQTIGQTENNITDALTGELVSPPILIENNYIQVQLAGGSHSILSLDGMTGVVLELLPAGANSSYPYASPAEVIGWASGDDSNTFKWKAFNISQYNDGTRYLRIRVIDKNTAGWGQTIVDNVYRSDELVSEYDLIDNSMIGSFDLDSVGTNAAGWTSTFTSDVVGNQEGSPIVIGGQAVNTCISGACDSTTGTMTSGQFEIKKDHINFATIGGDVGKQVFVKLLVDVDDNGSFVEQYSETPTICNVSGQPYWVNWDVSVWKGKQAKVEIIDNETDACGFIVVDQIHQSNISQ
ncbi:hypothetical protein [Vibrio viridaestus]|uniref:Uncharacterized protein n=1 Tax=Vibrio viridaestus TaxID=2487322 RepID=A0A3N9TZX4_9VIBR|nr:hypothetical protein [Vibrio viridaestus]RQW62522.1 hypothetical protein EES38_12405 [Vibrio viridaestus]